MCLESSLEYFNYLKYLKYFYFANVDENHNKKDKMSEKIKIKAFGNLDIEARDTQNALL